MSKKQYLFTLFKISLRIKSVGNLSFYCCQCISGCMTEPYYLSHLILCHLKPKQKDKLEIFFCEFVCAFVLCEFTIT